MFTRKLVHRSHTRKLNSVGSDYATVSIPAAVAAIPSWSDASDVVLCYDKNLNVLIMTPVGDDHAVS